MNDNIRFSFVVPFFNEAQKLPSLIKSLLNQSYKRDAYEIILVDNLSSDNSCAVSLNALAGFDNYKIATCNDYRSSYAARNVGWRVARGKYIIFIDADCVADQNLLKEYSQCVDTVDSENVGIFAGAILAFSRDNLSYIERFSAERKFLNQDSAVKGWAHRPFAQTANAMFPRAVLDAVGGFNPRVTSGGDGELCWRIFDVLGKRLEYAKNAVVFHWHRENLGDLFAQFEKYGVGRFQQSGIVPGFDKGLVGITKETLIERFEHLEQQILTTTDPSLHTSLLWSLYDLVTRVSNVYGYLGAKSRLSDSNKAKTKLGPFSAPSFPHFCSVCGAPNPDLSPTFAARVERLENTDTCATCGSNSIYRLIKNLAKANREDFCGDISIDNIAIFNKNLNPAELEKSKIYTLLNPPALSDALFAVQWAYKTGSNLVMLSVLETNDELSVAKSSYINAGFEKCGIFRDNYDNKNYIYWFIGNFFK